MSIYIALLTNYDRRSHDYVCEGMCLSVWYDGRLFPVRCPLQISCEIDNVCACCVATSFLDVLVYFQAVYSKVSCIQISFRRINLCLVSRKIILRIYILFLSLRRFEMRVHRVHQWILKTGCSYLGPCVLHGVLF